MHESIRQQLKPGAQVRVTQQIAARGRTWTSEVDGTVLHYEQKQTGSWFAHSKNDKLWLDRLTLRKTDGEIVKLNLDEYSHIEIAEAAGVAAAKANESALPR
jgi:hypothetical protein